MKAKPSVRVTAACPRPSAALARARREWLRAAASSGAPPCHLCKGIHGPYCVMWCRWRPSRVRSRLGTAELYRALDAVRCTGLIFAKVGSDSLSENRTERW